MKKLFACIMAAFVCLASCAFAFVTPASAASVGDHIEGWFIVSDATPDNPSSHTFRGSVTVYYNPTQLLGTLTPIDFADGIPAYAYCKDCEITYDPNVRDTVFLGSYTDQPYFDLIPENPIYFDPEMYEPVLQLLSNMVVYVDGVIPTDGDPNLFDKIFTPYNPFEGLADYLPTPSVPTPSPTPTNGGIYGAIFELISDCFYGENATLTGDQQLVATVLATAAIVFMFALPFLIVWLLIRSIGSWR